MVSNTKKRRETFETIEMLETSEKFESLKKFENVRPSAATVLLSIFFPGVVACYPEIPGRFPWLDSVVDMYL